MQMVMIGVSFSLFQRVVGGLMTVERLNYHQVIPVYQLGVVEVA